MYDMSFVFFKSFDRLDIAIEIEFIISLPKLCQRPSEELLIVFTNHFAARMHLSWKELNIQVYNSRSKSSPSKGPSKLVPSCFIPVYFRSFQKSHLFSQVSMIIWTLLCTLPGTSPNFFPPSKVLPL